jgi:hypothetical protein
MSVRTGLAVTLLALLVAAAWTQRDRLPWRSVVRPLQRALTDQSTERPTAGAAGSVGGVRRCALDSGIVYTDGDCPRGSRQQSTVAESLTVVPAAPVPQAPDPTASAATLRDLALKPGEPTLREKHMAQQLK